MARKTAKTKPVQGSRVPPWARSKYKAVKTEVDGWNFDSKAEAAYYTYLKILQAQGDVSHFLRQTTFHLPGHIIYRLDFLVFWADGRVTYEDVKGFETPEFKLKKRLVEEVYGIELTLIKKGKRS